MLKLPVLRRILIVISLLVLLAPADLVSAVDYDEPIIVDALEAHDRSLRDDGDVVEGFWGIYMDLQPEQGASNSFRMAVVKNGYGVYEDSDYVGIVTCDKPGCTRGEIKLLLKKTDDPKKLEATLLVGGKGIASGIAELGPHKDTAREDSMLDMSSLRYDGKLLTYGMVRIMEG